MHIIKHILEDKVEKEVSLAVNGEEGRILFIDHEVSAEKNISQ